MLVSKVFVYHLRERSYMGIASSLLEGCRKNNQNYKVLPTGGASFSGVVHIWGSVFTFS